MANRRLAKSRVGVLGSGDVGRCLAAGFASRGHDVMIGSRDPEKLELREWLSGDGAGTKAGSFAQAAAYGELLVLALLGNAAEEAIADAGRDNFSGKVVIDAMNPLDFSRGFPPKLSITGEDSLGERVQRAVPDARVVKAFNTIGNPYFVDPNFSQGQPTMLIAGNDEGAKNTVRDVLGDFGWSDVLDIGGIEGSRARGDLHRLGENRSCPRLIRPRVQAPLRLAASRGMLVRFRPAQRRLSAVTG